MPVKTGEFICKVGTTANSRRGVSLFNDSSQIPSQYQNPLNLVGNLNTTRLAIEQRGSNTAHFEIVPVLAECNGTTQMTQATYETLLKGVTLKAQ